MIAGLRSVLVALLALNLSFLAVALLLGAGDAAARFALGAAAAAVLLDVLRGVEHFLDNPPADWNLHG